MSREQNARDLGGRNERPPADVDSTDSLLTDQAIKGRPRESEQRRRLFDGIGNSARGFDQVPTLPDGREILHNQRLFALLDEAEIRQLAGNMRKILDRHRDEPG